MTEVKSHMHTFSSVDMVYIFSAGSLGGEDLDDNYDLLIFYLYGDCMNGLHLLM